MAYEKQTWQLGDVITKERIDHIEDGIYNNSIDVSDKIDTNGDSKNMVITGTSSDTTDADASSWTSVDTLASGETHSSIFAKISQMFKNIRYLYSHKIDIENIVDNLTTDNANKVLSAKQGKILNDNSLVSRGTIESGTNINNITDIGMYIINGSSSYTNLPTGITYGTLIITRGSTSTPVITQLITASNGNKIFQRNTTNNGSTWSDWIEMAKQSDVDTLNSSLPHRITSASASGSKVITFPTNSMNVIWTAGSGGDAQAAVFIVNTGSGSTITISDVKTATQVSHSNSGLSVTISNSNTGNGLRICCLNLYGEFPPEVA